MSSSLLEKNRNDNVEGMGRLNPTVPRLRTISDFDILGNLGQGTFGLVYKAREKKTGQLLALKLIRMESETQGFPITAIREITILKSNRNENIVNLIDVITGDDNDDVYLVFEYVDHDLHGLFELKPKEILKPEIIKSYIKQLLNGLHFLHTKKILHRDIKTSNLLISNKGILKLADFGLSRKKLDHIICTPDMITLWYRPPELLLKSRTDYGVEVDMWSVGCILAELLCRKAIFPGNTELEQLDLILRKCGCPDEETMAKYPNYRKVKDIEKYKFTLKEDLEKCIDDKNAIDLILNLLQLNPQNRLSAHKALDHDYFWSDPLPCKPEDIPYLGETCNEQSANQYKRSLRMNQELKKHRKHPYQRPNHPYPNRPNQQYPPPQQQQHQRHYNQNQQYQRYQQQPPQQRVSQTTYNSQSQYTNYQKYQRKGNYQTYVNSTTTHHQITSTTHYQNDHQNNVNAMNQPSQNAPSTNQMNASNR